MTGLATKPVAIRVAAAQYPFGQPATFEAWAANLAAWVERGAATGAQLLMFPEYGAIELAATGGEKVAGDLQATLAAVSLAVASSFRVICLPRRFRSTLNRNSEFTQEEIQQ